MARSPWVSSFKFLVSEAPPAAKALGIEHVLSPVLHIELRNLGISERFYALVDSGADYSFLPYEASVLLGVDPAGLTGPVLRNQGLGGEVRTRFTVFRLEVLNHNAKENLEIEMPFQVPIAPGPTTKLVLIGRHPFFDDFDVDFRMGYTDDPTIGKLVIREVSSRRDSRRVAR